jgi:hypothetical protein
MKLLGIKRSRPCGRAYACTSARARVYPRGQACVRTDALMSPRGHSASMRTHSLLPSLPSPPPSLPPSCPVRTDALGKGRKKFRFSVFNPQDPQDPQDPQASQALRAKPREEEGFFGLVPLVTHPSSIPLLGGLTPKFLSLSLHSL